MNERSQLNERPRLGDAELMSQLRRRAKTGFVESDLSRREFVASVGAKIDAAPQPRRSVPLPALAGLIGAVAILAVLVVAIPRLGPGAASPRPTPEAPPSTITAMGVSAFAARLATGELNGQQLMIVGEVRTEIRFGPICPISQDDLCYIGTLAGSAIDLHARPIPTLEGEGSAIPIGQSSWGSWRLPSPPTGIARTMAVSVDVEGVVELLGYTPPDEMSSALSEIQYVDFDALRPDEIRVVPAWLAGIEGPHRCGSHVPATPLGGLPERDQCGDLTWLTDDEVRFEPSHWSSPASSIRAQNGAYREYAQNALVVDGSAEPRAGAYVIAKRLEGAGCENAPPCWQWEVIGRLTLVDDGNLAQPLAMSTPMPSTVPPSPSSAANAPTPTNSPAGIEFVCTEPIARIGAVVTDETGIVEACATVDPTGEGISDQVSHVVRNPDGNLNELQIEWAGSPCTAATGLAITGSIGGLVIETGPRPDGDHLGAQVGDTWFCTANRVVHAVRLRLSQAIDAANVDLLDSGDSGPTLTPEPSPPPIPTSVQSQEIDVGTFTLTLVAGSAEYAPDEPIDIHAELLYEGGTESIVVAGVGNLVNGFGVRQLDGPYSMGPGWNEPCIRAALDSGVPRIEPFRKSAGWSEDDPLRSFYIQYLSEPELRLPAGSWLITAYSEFWAGPCSGEYVRLQASGLIDVHGPN